MALIVCSACNEKMSKTAKTCPHCGTVAKEKSSMLNWIVVIFAIIVFLPFLNKAPHNALESTASPPQVDKNPAKNEQQMATAQESRVASATHNREITLNLSLIKQLEFAFSWNTPRWNPVQLATLTITNNSQYSVKNIIIECVDAKNSGRKTIHNIVSANSTKQFIDINMGFIQTEEMKSGCKIVDLTVLTV